MEQNEKYKELKILQDSVSKLKQDIFLLKKILLSVKQSEQDEKDNIRLEEIEKGFQ